MTDKNKIINEPPDQLDGAKVMKWAWSGDRPFGLVGEIEIYGLAICRYDDSAEVYRLAVTKIGKFNRTDYTIQLIKQLDNFLASIN